MQKEKPIYYLRQQNKGADTREDTELARIFLCSVPSAISRHDKCKATEYHKKQKCQTLKDAERR